jgi:hypothetical protein
MGRRSLDRLFKRGALLPSSGAALLIAGLTLVSIALLGTSRSTSADGTIAWEGNGSDNLPCAGAEHWVLSPLGDITGATLHLLGSDYPMSGVGNLAVDTDVVLPEGIDFGTVTVSFTGTDSNSAHLQLSHCTSGEVTPTSTSTSTMTATATSTSTPIEQELESPTPTSTATEAVETETPTATSTATSEVSETPTATETSVTETPTATGTVETETPTATATTATDTPTPTGTVETETPTATATATNTPVTVVSGQQGGAEAPTVGPEQEVAGAEQAVAALPRTGQGSEAREADRTGLMLAGIVLAASGLFALGLSVRRRHA